MSAYTSLILSESALTNYWELQESSGTSAVDAKAANNGTYNAGYTLNQSAPANLGASVSFNGTSSQVTLPAESIPGPMSIELWLRFNAADVGQNGFLVLKKPVNGQWELFLEGSTLKLRGASSGSTVTATAPVDSSWHHVVGTISGTTGTIYIDGANCGSGTVTAIANGTSAGTNDLLIGNHGAGGYFYKGDVCHVALYNAALTAAQVASHYTAGTAALPLTVGARLKSGRPRLRRGHPLAAGLVAAWSWPGGYGEDLVGNQHLVPNGIVGFDGATGLVTNAAGSRPSYQKQLIGDPALALPYPLTLVWSGTQIAAPSTNVYLFGVSWALTDAPPYAAYAFVVNGTSNYTMQWDSGGTSRTISQGSTVGSPAPVWMAGTIASGAQAFYVNDPGTPVGTAAQSGVMTYAANYGVHFGCPSLSSSNVNPACAHDYGLIYSRILSAGELRWLRLRGNDLFARPRGRVGWVAALQGAQVVAGNPAALLPAM